MRYQQFLQEVPARSLCHSNTVWRWFESGKGPPTLIVLPGAVGGGNAFFLLVQELAPAIRVLALDLPMVSTADEALGGLKSVLEQAGVSSAYFLGASYSGLLVQALAKSHPQYVRGLILSHTGSLDPARTPGELRNAARARRLPGFVVRGAIWLLVRLVLRRHGSAAEFWRDVYKQSLNEVSPAQMASRYLLASELDRTQGVPYAGPVLVIHSDHDAITPDAQRQKLLRDYPRAQFNKFLGTGHSSYSLQPLEYAAAVRRFIEIGA